VLLVALAGLFAMHGMSDHGTTHHGGMTDTTFTETAASMEVAQAVHTSTDGALSAPLDAVATTTDGGTGAAMGVCLAVMAGLVLFLHRASRTWSARVLRSVLARGQVRCRTRARDPDPPDLFALSIQRC
jgi:hypothetical protein